MTRVLRTDILHDVGDPINRASIAGRLRAGLFKAWAGSPPKIDLGEDGRLLTHSPDTTKFVHRRYAAEFQLNSQERHAAQHNLRQQKRWANRR